MQLIKLICFLPIVLVSCQTCDKGSKADLDILLGKLTSYSEFVFKRHMIAEAESCPMIEEGLVSLEPIFNGEIRRKLNTLSAQPLGHILLKLQRYPPALSCTNQVSRSLQEKIREVQEDFSSCVKTTSVKFTRLRTTFRKDWIEFMELERSGLDGIQYCFQAYTNCQKEKRNKCVDTSRDTFFSRGKAIAEKHFNSPCMTEFKNVMECLDDAANRTDEALNDYIDSFFQCAESVPDEELKKNIAAQKPEKESYALNPKLVSQIEESRKRFVDLNKEIEATLLNYYNQEKQANETRLFVIRSTEELAAPISSKLAPYNAAIKGLGCVSDNNAYHQCVYEAEELMSYIDESFVAKSANCNLEMVTLAKARIAAMRKQLKSMVVELSYLGNKALLSCVHRGLLFKQDSIKECFNFYYRSFDMHTKNKTLQSVNSAIEILQTYNASYFHLDEKPLLCEENGFEQLQLEADEVLYMLGECVYAQTGMEETIDIDNPTVCGRKPRNNTEMVGPEDESEDDHFAIEDEEPGITYENGRVYRSSSPSKAYQRLFKL